MIPSTLKDAIARSRIISLRSRRYGGRALAAALESDSEHLIAQAIRHFARSRKLVIPPVSHFSALKGRGVQADFNGQTGYIGGPRLLEMLSLAMEANFRFFTDSANHRSQSVVYLTTNAKIIAAIPLAAGVLANWGILLSPAVGAVLMSISTIVVALNAQLLRRIEL